MGAAPAPMERGVSAEPGPVILGRSGDGSPASKQLSSPSGRSGGSPARRSAAGKPAPSHCPEAGSLSRLLRVAAQLGAGSRAAAGSDAAAPARPQLSRKASWRSRASTRSRVFFSASAARSTASTVRSSLSNLVMMVHKSTTRVLAFKFTQVWGDADGDQTLRGMKLADDSDDEAQEAEGLMRRMSTWRSRMSAAERVPDVDPKTASGEALPEEQPSGSRRAEDSPRPVASRTMPMLPCVSDGSSVQKPMRHVRLRHRRQPQPQLPGERVAELPPAAGWLPEPVAVAVLCRRRQQGLPGRAAAPPPPAPRGRWPRPLRAPPGLRRRRRARSWRGWC
ncbi:unnamed protein product [Prorocentrum cordatum]|uniref:Uncharacterized protein n=1 Tax=Prorocentrum cordatum TaxID=2364126 RepID=A0ABN9S3V8_9DINO|nr:unnamed protein product [Polarella glacialis]